MKHFLKYLVGLSVVLIIAGVAVYYVRSSVKEEEFTDDLQQISQNEMEMLEGEDVFEDSSQEFQFEQVEDSMQPMDSVNGDESEGESQVEEEGTYTGKEDVSAYLHEFQRLPSNYITTEEAEKLGFRSEEDNLEEVAPGKSIGGDPYENLNKMLPEEAGRTYKECDIDFDGTKRNSKRLIYSSDGLIFYTEDNCETFIQLY